MAGQIASAELILCLIEGSALIDRGGAIHDPYSLRCAPQVHGAVRDALEHVRGVVTAEINAATDNPLFFDEVDGSFSGGNFHGQPIALAADFLAIAVCELASISERRTQMLLDPNWNRGLPANLVANPGVNSGFMVAQYTAASLVSENKVLAHPASVDSIPTSANAEDHVSMSTHAARKLRTILRNTQAALAIEALVAAQGLEWRVTTVDGDETRKGDARQAARDQQLRFAESTRADQRAHIAARLGQGTRIAYLAVRGVAPPLIEDRVLDGDIANVRKLVESGRLAHDVRQVVASRAVPADM